MWPVGPPEHTIRKSLDNAPREWDHVAIGVLLAIQRGRAGDRQTLRTTDLGPHVWVFPHEFHEQLELGTIDRLLDVGPPHMVDDDGGRKCSEEIPQLWQIHCFEVDDHMPAQFLDAARNLDQLLPRREVNKTLDEIEAHTAHA